MHWVTAADQAGMISSAAAAGIVALRPARVLQPFQAFQRRALRRQGAVQAVPCARKRQA